MRSDRTYLFIIISSFALLIILIIQINWIFKTAKIREDIFNEKANLVLSRTAEALSTNKEAFNDLQLSVGKSEAPKIDSLFNYFMKLYNIHIDYYFEVNPSQLQLNNVSSYRSTEGNNSESYQTCIEGESPMDNLDLKLVFPKKEQFIKAEMGSTFITSIVLIVLVLIISWRTILALIKQKRIAEHTNDFLNNMTHEFKTPITNIALAGKMILKDVNLGGDNKIRQYSEIILKENEKLQYQVEQVLSISTLERGDIILNNSKFDIHELINDCIKTFGVQIETKNGNILSELKAINHFVNGDKIQMENAICNLIDNAIKYSKEVLLITVSSINENSNIIIKISDNGIGIDKQYQSKVFEKYFRVPTGNIHDVKVFGLGLTTIKRIIEMHNGSIEIESHTRKGATFIISLPNA